MRKPGEGEFVDDGDRACPIRGDEAQRTCARSSSRRTGVTRRPISAAAWCSAATGSCTHGRRASGARARAKQPGSRRQGAAPQRRRHACRPTTRSSASRDYTGDLLAGSPQPAGARGASGHGRALGERARSARRRRDQHRAARAQLWLAARDVRQELRRRADQRARQRGPTSSRRSCTGCPRSRSRGSRSTPATASLRGRATRSSAR